MYDCKECGKNNWGWKCEQGIMQGICKECGAKTNKFKAHTGRGKEKAETKEKNNNMETQ